jgi:hypothetical protein
MAKINIIEGYVGKVGTSFFATLLLEYLIANSHNPILVDLDRLKFDVLQRYKSRCTFETRITLDPADLSRTSSLDYLLTLVYEGNCEAVVNVPVGRFDDIEAFLGEDIFDETPVRRWFVTDLSPRSWEIFDRVVEANLQQPHQLILVHNMHGGSGVSLNPPLDESGVPMNVRGTLADRAEFLEENDIPVVKMGLIDLPPHDRLVLDDLNKFNLSLPELVAGFSGLGQRIWSNGLASVGQSIQKIDN